jgi:hypothetical protein
MGFSSYKQEQNVSNCMFHIYDTRNKTYLFQVITPTYLNTLSHGAAWLFVADFLKKLKVLDV